jgi:hypothetical protein
MKPLGGGRRTFTLMIALDYGIVVYGLPLLWEPRSLSSWIAWSVALRTKSSRSEQDLHKAAHTVAVVIRMRLDVDAFVRTDS